jgi:poly(A) polymerase
MHLPEFDSNRITYRFLGTTALDHLLELPAAPLLFAEVDAGVVEIASLIEERSFPGLSKWDLAIVSGGKEVLVRDADGGDPPISDTADPFSTFSWSPRRRAFGDPHGLYPLLKAMRERIKAIRGKRHHTLADVEPVTVRAFPEIAAKVGSLAAPTAAILAARYPIQFDNDVIAPWNPHQELPSRFHRDLLALILTGPWAHRGLDTLLTAGYVDDILPELARMDRTEQSKEGHPEGNVWKHTIETLRYRKDRDELVGLALLLHDCGKPQSSPSGHKRFDGHADIGARIARGILQRLEYDSEMIENVQWLVRYHMIPGALRRLPDYRRDPFMRSELFPLLLEVYRCDLSSTFRGPDNYYDACAVYRRYLKANRGAYSASHRRMVEHYVE